MDTVRASASLILAMFVLGRMYYSYIPPLASHGVYGAIVLGIILIFFFLAVGWIYDVRLQFWNEAMQATIERGVYYFVPSPRSFAIEYPFFYAIVRTLREIVREGDNVDSSIDDFIRYADGFYRLQPSRRDDIYGALPRAHAYILQHPFKSSLLEASSRVPLGSRIKKSFQIQIMRIGWIQSLTGLAQDVLVLAAFYLVVLFPDVAEGDVVPIQYLIFGIIFISFPLFILLLALGWYYDRRLQLWSPIFAVEMERDPFNYVPPPKVKIMTVPFVYTFLRVTNDILKKRSLDNSSILSFARYLQAYTMLDIADDADIRRAITLRSSLGSLFQRGETAT